MLKVEDIMTRTVLTLDPDAKLGDAAWGLTIKGVSGAPVRDGNGHVLGVLSKSDLVARTRKDEAAKSQKVKEAMTPALIAVRAQDPVREAAKRMVDTGTHRAIVIDDGGHLVGIVTPMDVVRAYVRGELTDPWRE